MSDYRKSLKSSAISMTWVLPTTRFDKVLRKPEDNTNSQYYLFTEFLLKNSLYAKLEYYATELHGANLKEYCYDRDPVYFISDLLDWAESKENTEFWLKLHSSWIDFCQRNNISLKTKTKQVPKKEQCRSIW
jgi:hypothetical protein